MPTNIWTTDSYYSAAAAETCAWAAASSGVQIEMLMPESGAERNYENFYKTPL